MTVQLELFPYVAVPCFCRRCGRALRKSKNRVAGIGPVCARKELMECVDLPHPVLQGVEVGVAGPLLPTSLLLSPKEGKVGVSGGLGAKQGVPRQPVGVSASPYIFSFENDGFSPTTPTFLAFSSEKSTSKEAFCGEGEQSRGDCVTPTFSSSVPAAAAVEGGVK